jgi:3',5'-cyclic AMP phosphodiesterase CpdA
MKFIHLSDLHFHRIQSENEDIIKRLDYIGANYPSHKLIITGDIVHDGAYVEFRNAFKALERFKELIFFCPGNHDFGKGGTNFSQECVAFFDSELSIPLQQKSFAGPKTPVVFQIKEGLESVLLIALNTCLETDPKSDWARGRVGQDQLASLKGILAMPAYAEMVKILFFHHHPFRREDLINRLVGEIILDMEDSSELMNKIRGEVQVVLFGHKHHSNSWPIENGSWPNTNGPWPDPDPNGIKYVLASGNSCKYFNASEITIEDNKVKEPHLIPIIDH